MVVVFAIWLLLEPGMPEVENRFGWPHQLATEPRRLMLAAAAAFYFLRTLATVFIFIRRRMPWQEVGAIALWVAIIDVLFAFAGGRNGAPFGLTGMLGTGLMLVGSVVNTGSELQRHIWKRQPENAGHVYTRGLFRFSRHINYFGDEMLFTGWALMAGRAGLLAIPIIMAFGFIFASIPAQERHMEERYGNEYRRYAAAVKRFIPYVY